MATKDVHDTWTLRPDDVISVVHVEPLRYAIRFGKELSVVVSDQQMAILMKSLGLHVGGNVGG